jgi:asparagine synthase (glutamine-hydrolysing)
MCGIAGIIAQHQGVVNTDVLLQMSTAIRHRGPDGEGHWINESGTVGLAHRRLSIIDLDVAANQPMHYLDRYVIVFNGEIYNYLEIKSDLEKKGYQFRTKSDTEVLVALFDHKGKSCLSDLDGMFSFVIYDKVKNRIFGARDRFGEKPLYISSFGNNWYFASEMKAIWAAGIPRIPDKKMLYLYLAYGTQQDFNVPQRTFFEGISQVEPGCYLEIDDNNNLTFERYWDVDLSKKLNISLQEAAVTFLQLFTDSISLRLRSDVPVGSSLSGGLDSSSIVMLIDKLRDESVIQKTFSARFRNFERDEGKFIDIINHSVHAEAHEVFLSPDKLQRKIEEVAVHQEEPFGSTSVIAQWEVMALARQNNVTVLLDGQGADEILAGYFHYFGPYFGSLLRRKPISWLKQMRLFSELHGKKYPLENGWWLDVFSPGVRTGFRRLKNAISTPGYIAQFSSEMRVVNRKDNYRLDYPVNLNASLQFVMMRGGLQNLLRYADRNSMAHSREVRLPFLNYKLVEFIYALPDEYKLHDGWTKFLLRKSMEHVLPTEICWRKDKVGFEPPRNRDVPEDMLRRALDVLCDNNILEKNRALSSLKWEYVQASLLYQ